MKQLEALQVDSMAASELQNYADIVTHAFPDAVFLRSISAKDCDDYDVGEMTAPPLANIAYVSLQAKIPGNRDEAARCLIQLQDLLRGRRKR